MVPLKFAKVWYLPDENRWRDMNLLAFRDTGELILHEKTMEFRGRKETVVITQVQSVSYGRQGRDNWVRVEYGESPTPSVAYFADGSMLGWGGILGGTKRILEAVRHL
jgi:hypothetical protein